MTAPINPRPLAPGDVIHGFAYGAFGRDHHTCVRVEAVGLDWIVARDPACDPDEDCGPSYTSGSRSLQLCQQARDEPCLATPCPIGAPQPLTTFSA
ncbi:hypothetical protein [Streptomyces sp. SCA2-2]|uniref:hypothetical protein n=1 Tax=Streptomyces sp. SCA2-2 TaxID=1563677 RepID=UPI00101EAFB9|nr:hypothetical protein [Streptomyces sp. SCA2-2]RZE89162.1 hypothetical protein C0L86_28840 [Streptomyces sp. SCA2-2]